MKKTEIHLEKVTFDNAGAIARLRVAKEQRDYVADNNWSLIQAYCTLAEGKPVFPFGIYNGKTPVGFMMLNYVTDWTGYEREAWLSSDAYRFYEGKPYYYLWRFMIDRRFQNRGYGREALRQSLDFVRTFPCGEAEYCVLSYEPDNEVAKNFYSSFGFTELNGPGYYEDGDEISAVLKL